MHDKYKEDNKLYLEHLLEQYKIYVEMADRISARRHAANVFFLTLHSSAVAAIGFTFDRIEQIDSRAILIFPLIALFVFCIVWWWLIRSYRNLNSAKYKVIGKMEELLPYSPYWAEEWKELGEGKDWRKYLQLTVIEQWVPVMFGLIYLSLVFLLFASW
jgi:hypothetical protein